MIQVEPNLPYVPQDVMPPEVERYLKDLVRRLTDVLREHGIEINEKIASIIDDPAYWMDS